jgi:hypothetical protein
MSEGKLDLSGLETLIMVPGHAVYVGSELGHSRVTAHWRGTFEGYQDNDEAILYTEHIRTGVLIAARGEKPKSLLLFSGGETRWGAGPYSEAQSYWFLANQNAWFGHPEVEKRATTEEFARDSFENLLFSLHRFYQLTRNPPALVVVCGFSFKQKRYELHWETIENARSDPRINLPSLSAKFKYVGVNDPPPYLLKGPGGSEEGEAVTYKQWQDDPYGERPPLCGKEEERDPFRHPPLTAFDVSPVGCALRIFYGAVDVQVGWLFRQPA